MPNLPNVVLWSIPAFILLLVAIARDFVAAASWRERFARVFAAPGWKS